MKHLAPKHLWLAIAVLMVIGGTVGAQVDNSKLHHQEHPESSPILAFYDFEEPTPSGPDTFWVRQREGNEIALSDAFKVSGERSLHISEVPGNRTSPSSWPTSARRGDGRSSSSSTSCSPIPSSASTSASPAAVVPEQRAARSGHLAADRRRRLPPPAEPGLAQLFAPRPFAWYFIDFVYDVEDGTYDLRIHEEGLEEPLVDLRDATSFNGHPDSSVRFFSLIGDLEDAGRFDFFVDDLMIATHPEVRLTPFVAPGRRRYFVDSLAVAPARDLSSQAMEDVIWQARRWLDEVGRGANRTRLDKIEAAADAAFHAGRLDFAAEAYDRLREDPERTVRMLLKLSDVAHLAGDTARERELREGIYGRLEVEY